MKTIITLLLAMAVALGLNCSKESVTEPPLEFGLSYVGQFQTNGPAVNVDIYDNMAIIAEAENGIEIVNLDDPANPALLSHLELPGYTDDICADNGIIYTASGAGGVYFVDFSNPSNPTIIGHPYMGSLSPNIITKLNDHIFMAQYDYDRLYYFNVSNPRNPASGLYGWGLQEGYRVLSTSPDYLYALTPNILAKLAISVEGHPTVQQIGFINFFEEQPLDMYWQNTFGWVINSRNLMQIDSDLEIIDTIPVDFLNLDAKDFDIDFAVDYPYLFILDKSNGLRIFDLTDSQLIDTYEIGNPASIDNRPIALFYQGGYIYIADGESGLRILKFNK